MFKLAELFVNVVAKTEKVEKGLDTVKAKVQGTATAFNVFLGSLASNIAFRALEAIPALFDRTIKAAADMNETVSKLGVIFGDSAKIITAQADLMADQFSTVKAEAIDGASQLGMLFRAVGMGQAEAAKRGSQMAMLAANTQSQDNIRFADVVEKLRAGLSGESEPLKSLGIFMNEEKVGKVAVDSKYAKDKKAIDDRAKVMARAEIITKSLERVEGDLARTIDSTANATRRHQGTLINLGESIGQVLLPIWDQVIQGFGVMTASLATGFQNSRDAMNQWVEGMLQGIDRIVIYWTELPAVWEAVKIAAGSSFAGIFELASALGKNLALFAEWLANNWVGMILDAFQALYFAFTNLGKNIAELGRAIGTFLADPTQGFEPNFVPLLDGFRAFTKKLPEFVAVEMGAAGAQMINESIDMFAKIEEKVTARTEARKKKADAMAKAKADEQAKNTPELKSETLGFTEFRRKLEAAAQAAKDRIPEQSLEQQKKTAENTKQIVDMFTRGFVIGGLAP